MKHKFIPITFVAVLTAAGCADTGPHYASSPSDRPEPYGYDDRYGQDRYGYDQERRPVSYTGRVADVETIQVQPGYRFGVGSVIGAVAGGLLGSQIGEGSGSTAATIAGAAIGGAAGTAAESQLQRQTATRVTVDLRDGGRATIVQPYDPRIERGMRVTIVGAGENARVVPAA